MEAPPLEDPDENGPTTEEKNFVLLDPSIEMVKKQTMALNRWFMTAPTSRGPTSSQSTPQQTTPPVPKQQRKQHKCASSAVTQEGTPPAAHLPTPVSGRSSIPLASKTPQET